MKYRVLRSFLWLKAGEVVETSEKSEGTYVFHNKNITDDVWIRPDRYPNDFAHISEKEEQIEAAKKLLEGEGWALVKPGIIPEGTAVYRCEKCNKDTLLNYYHNCF